MILTQMSVIILQKSTRVERPPLTSNPAGGGPSILMGSDAKNSSACSYAGLFFR